MNVVQSYLTTIMRGEFSLYEVRIFMKIVELANASLKGKPAKEYLGTIVSMDGVNCNCTIPIRSILTPGSNDYTKVKLAVKRLLTKTFELTDETHKVWHYTVLLNDVSIATGDGKLRFTVPLWLMRYIMNLIDNHFTTYDLATALSLPTPYSVRMYWLTCSMEKPLPYSIKMLRAMLGASDKYKTTKDFIRRCIDPAQRILEERKLNGFRYQKIMSKNKIAALQIIPIVRQVKPANQEVARAPLSVWAPKPLRDYLTQQCGFKSSDLTPHKALLFAFSQIPNYQDLIVDIEERKRRDRKSNGWEIQAMRSECQNRGLKWQ